MRLLLKTLPSYLDRARPAPLARFLRGAAAIAPAFATGKPPAPRLLRLATRRAGIGCAQYVCVTADRNSPGAAAELGAGPDLDGTERERDSAHKLVLYVEDNATNIALVESVFEDFEGVDLLTAPTAEEGLELVRSKHPDAVIMDIHLPGMSGVEATRQLQATPQTRDIPVIALSAAANLQSSHATSHAHFYRYLAKPLNIELLIRTLEEVLGTRRSIRPPGA